MYVYVWIQTRRSERDTCSNIGLVDWIFFSSNRAATMATRETAQSRLVNENRAEELEKRMAGKMGGCSTKTHLFFKFFSELAASACKWSNIIGIDWRAWLLDRQLCISLTTVSRRE